MTVGASFLPLCPFSIGIAVLKGGLVFWYFMHLREEGGIVRLAALGAGAWLLILLLLTASDFATCGWL